MKNILFPVALSLMSAVKAVTLVEDGRPVAPVVLADESLPAEQLAAEELVRFVERASGAKLAVVKESAAPKSGPRILLGRAAGLKDLPRGGGRVTAEDETVRIAGGDDHGHPKNKIGVVCGTLNVVYEFLDRELGVRFLWPDESGIVVRPKKTFAVSGSYEYVPPFENVRIRKFPILWARRAARVVSTPVNWPSGGSGGHAFEDWWRKYGKEHPDFFPMDGKGAREVGPGTCMCVANPAFHEEIVRLWREARTKEPGKVFAINACENDTKGRCRCPMCTAWNDPAADPGDASERYAHFYKALYELAAKDDPSVRVYGYAYSNYRNAPRGFKLPENVMIGFVPSPKFPYNAKWRADILGAIGAWQRSGCTLNYRPNLLDGYAMPEDISTDYYTEFQAMRKANMKSIDIDGPNQSYSTQGPFLYILARMMVHPDWPLERLKDEYYSAFGPAKDAVKEYWERWNRYALDNAETFHEVPKKYNPIRHGMFFGFHYAFYAHHLFPQETLERGVDMLKRAAAAAKDSPDDLKRVRFLAAGLRHAMLCSKACATFADRAATKEAKLAALKAVRDFRAKSLPPWASDVKMFTAPGYCEMLAWPYATYDPDKLDELPRSVVIDGRENRPAAGSIPVVKGAAKVEDGRLVFASGKVQHGTLGVPLPLPGGREVVCTFKYRSVNGGRHRLTLRECEFPRIPPHKSTEFKLPATGGEWRTETRTIAIQPETVILNLYFEGRMSDPKQSVEYEYMKFEYKGSHMEVVK